MAAALVGEAICPQSPLGRDGVPSGSKKRRADDKRRVLPNRPYALEDAGAESESADDETPAQEK
jgi:hypothetical protein